MLPFSCAAPQKKKTYGGYIHEPENFKIKIVLVLDTYLTIKIDHISYHYW